MFPLDDVIVLSLSAGKSLLNTCITRTLLPLSDSLLDRDASTKISTLLNLATITGFGAEACWPLNGPLFSPLNPLFYHYWPAHRAGLLRCNFFDSVSKFPPFLWVKLWVGWVGRGYTEISRYFPASWINRVTLVTKIKLWYSLGYQITFESPKMPLWYFFASRSLIQFVQYTIPPPAASLIGWLFILGYTDCNTVPTWWM